MRIIVSIILFLSCATLFAQPEKLPCKVALVQAHLAWGDVEGNLSAFEKRILQCQGCDLIIFPELFTSGCEMQKKEKAFAMDSKDKVAAQYKQILKKMKSWAAFSQALVIGSTIYKDNEKYYNRLLAIFPDGKVHYYDKHNCFKKGSYSSGDKQLILTWKGRRLATYICYDLRFPEWSQNNGAYDTAIYIANWPESRRSDWKKLLKERAIENKASIIGVNCAGADLAGLMYAGDSMLLSPEGEILGSCQERQDDILIINL